MEYEICNGLQRSALKPENFLVFLMYLNDFVIKSEDFILDGIQRNKIKKTQIYHVEPFGATLYYMFLEPENKVRILMYGKFEEVKKLERIMMENMDGFEESAKIRPQEYPQAQEMLN